MWITQTPWNALVSAIFWDYENVPLRHVDWNRFLQGLVNYANSTRVVFARVYARKKTLSSRDRKLIRSIGLFDFKWVQSDDTNAADYSLINSCIGVLKNNARINNVLLITGDGDFHELTERLDDWQVSVYLICQLSNYSKNLVKGVHRAYSVTFVASYPTIWWMYTAN